MKKTSKKYYWIIAIGAAIGLISAFLQTIEKMILLGQKDAALPCNLNDVFSCSAVLNAPQSSLFGFPNSLLCIVFFTTVLVTALIGTSGSNLTKNVRLAIHGLSFFMLLFALWFLFTSTFVIGAICIFCLFCFAGLLMVNGSLWRLNFPADIPSKKGNFVFLNKMTRLNLDFMLWIALATLVIGAIIIKFSI